jgi:predicted  nucleic acid-binding Zn-ribbon protein
MKTEGEKTVIEKDRNEVLLDLIASGYHLISEQDREISSLKADFTAATQANEKLKNDLDSITQSNDRLYENFKTLSKKLQDLESAEIDDGK